MSVGCFVCPLVCSYEWNNIALTQLILMKVYFILTYLILPYFTLRPLSLIFVSRDSSFNVANRVRARRPGFDFRQGRIFLFATASRPALGLTTLLVHGYRVLSPGVKLTTHLHLVQWCATGVPRHTGVPPRSSRCATKFSPLIIIIIIMR
jgi:hypothetical protein